MNTLVLKSPRDGSLLTFEIRARRRDEIEFDLVVKTPRFAGVVSASTFMVQSPADLFREMADEWTGWKEEKTWSDLERNVTIAATSDSTGHVSLHIVLDGQDGDSLLRVRLEFEAGQLQSIASEIASLFQDGAAD
ncbi:MAG: DUF6228 family protein [Massilia sp.]